MKLIVGNWKMNGLHADSLDLAGKLAASGLHMVVCPPATQIAAVAGALKGSQVAWGGQDCSAEGPGAFTGDIAAEMLKDLGCAYVILGHSERRQIHGETSAQVKAKARKALSAGLVPIVCVGEVLQERETGQHEAVVAKQLADSLPEGKVVVAYEPVWAIGTGKVASPEDIKAMHAFIRGKVGAMPILYGGSVKAANAKEILSTPEVDGVLVGGASLKAGEFIAIAEAGRSC